MPVTSIKSMIGHCLGAAGGVEAAALALTVARQIIPPTISSSGCARTMTPAINKARPNQTAARLSSRITIGSRNSEGPGRSTCGSTVGGPDFI